MMLTTTENIPGRDYEIIGLVKGNMIKTRNIGRDIGAGLKSIVGGELKNYTDMMNEARATATRRMVEEAEAIGADAIVMIRYSTADILQGAAEILVIGTAVKFR